MIRPRLRPSPLALTLTLTALATCTLSTDVALASSNSLQGSPVATPALAAGTNVFESQFSGEETAGGSFAPYSTAVSSGGDVFVADSEHGVVDEYERNGASGYKLLHEVKPESGSFEPYGLAVDSSGDLYVGDVANGVVDVFEPESSSPSGFELIHTFGGGETASTSFYPWSLVVGAGGDVSVGDIVGGVVDEFEPDNAAPSGYKLLHELNGSETAAQSFSPYGLTMNAEGDLWVTNFSEGVLDEFAPSADAPSGYRLLREVTGTATPQGAFGPFDLATAPNGDLYIADLATGHDLVDRFSATGTYECQIAGTDSAEQCGGEASKVEPQESLGEPYGLAVGPTGTLYIGDVLNKVVDTFSASGSTATDQWVTDEATDVAATTAVLNGTVNPEGSPVIACDFEYGTEEGVYDHSATCKQSEEEIGDGTSPFAVSAEVSRLEPGTKYYFRVAGEGLTGAGHGEQVTFTTNAKPPTGTIKPVSGISAHCATFNGEVDPEGSAATYQFEDSENGTTWTAQESAGAGEGESDVVVSQEICGLLGSTTYHVRLRAENAGGHFTSSEVSFPTPPSGPQLDGVGASVLGEGEATLYATVYPEGEAATYRFEYGASSAYGTTVPAGEASEVSTPSQVTQTITGLQPGSVYHFRVVAVNATSTTYGGDKTFMTPPIAPVVAPGACPNEALRSESNINPTSGAPYSAHLPDCRAYEQVTPPFKGGDGVGDGPVSILLGQTIGVENISASGTPLRVKSLVQLGDVPAGTDFETEPTSYSLARTASGWMTAPLTPPAKQFPTATEELASETNAAVGLWSAATPEQSVYAEDIYVREADGEFVNIGPEAPPSSTAGPAHGANPKTLGVSTREDGVVGASTDSTDVVFQLDSPITSSEQSYLWPRDKTVVGPRPSLYEYVGTTHSGEGTEIPTLVGVTNNGEQISQCGSGLGSDSTSTPRSVHDGISAGGSTIFFTAQAGGCTAGASGPATNQVYARVGVPGSAQTTVNVAGTTGCANSISCNLMSAVTYQGASQDGSRVFVTAAQAGLVEGDTDATNALYECELPGDNSTMPASRGVVNACPNLKVISTALAGGAEVQSVVAVSEEGARVYFIAKGKLTDEPDSSLQAGQQVATEGENNLYVWEADGDDGKGRTAFVATVPTSELLDAQATPDGRYLVFTTTADLTAGDTSAAAQAFRYDASTGEMIRISAGQNGFDNNGNTNSDPAILASTKIKSGATVPTSQYRTVSDNGAYVVFQSSAALTPEVEGGVNNVYEWHEGNVYLLSDGTDNSERAGLIGMDATGENIFFVTADKLVGQDADEDYDVYDARIDGGFPAPTPPVSCKGEECQGALTSPFSPPAPGSTGTPSIGNLTPGSTVFPPASEAKPKPLTRAEKLRKALELCRKRKSKRKRKSCEAAARKKYGPRPKPTSKKRKKK